MNVHSAIMRAERLLPGVAALEGEKDPRWQSIIEVSEFIDSDPGAVWDFTLRWGCHIDPDLQAAIATCLLEHLLEDHFERFFPHVETAVRANENFAATFRVCSKFGQSEEPANSARFDRLKESV